MRIVSLAPSATELIFALGCGDSLVARTAFCDYPAEAQRIPTVGGWTTANTDAVVALQPDLVLTSTFLQQPVVDDLERRGMRVFHTDPRTLADVLESFESTAAALGVLERGKALRQRSEADLAILASPSSTFRVYAEEWHQPPMAAGNWVPDLIALAGGQSFLPSGERSRKVDLEEIQRFDPDVIILNYCGMEHLSTDAQRKYVLTREGWGALPVVQERRVHVIRDSLLNRPGPRLVEGARELHRVFEILHHATRVA